MRLERNGGTQMRLERTTNGWSNGRLTIVFQHYNPRDTQRWFAKWTDIFNVEHTMREFTRERLVRNLGPYGMGKITFGKGGAQ